MVRAMELSLACLVVALFPSLAFSQTPEPTATTADGQQQVDQVLTPEERAEFLRLARQILATVGEQEGAQAAPQAAQEQKPAQDGKTTADVADRALEVFEKYGDKVVGLVARAAGTLEKAAPKIWRIMVVKQYATAFSDLVVPWGLFILVLVYAAVIRRKWQPDDAEEQSWHTGLTAVLPIIACIVFGIWGVVSISDTIKLLIVPEYYAFRDLLYMILKQQAP